MPFARECGDLGTVGDSVRCSDEVAPAVYSIRGLRLHRASLSLLRLKKVSKERRALRAALHLITTVLFSGFAVVMLARSRLAINFCALHYFRGVGMDIRRVGKPGLPTWIASAFAMPVIPLSGQLM